MAEAENVTTEVVTKAKKRVDKLTLNNYIVCMRPNVKRARLWLLNHLINRTRILKKKKGSEEQIAKNQRKVARNLAEIEILKQLDVDEVSKYSLCTKYEPKNLESQLEKLDIDQRAMLRLSTHKLIQDKVVKFRETYSVSSDKLILVIRALGMRHKKKPTATGANTLELGNKDSSEKKGNRKIKAGIEGTSDMEVVFTDSGSDSESDAEEEDKEEDLDEEKIAPLKITEQEVQTNSESGSEEEDKEEDLEEEEDTAPLEVTENYDNTSPKVEEKEVEKSNTKAKTVKSKTKPPKSTVEIKKPEKVAAKVDVKKLAPEVVKSDVKKVINIQDITVNKEKKDVQVHEDLKTEKKEQKTRLKIAWPVAADRQIDKKEGTMHIKRLDMDKLDESSEIVLDDPKSASTSGPAASSRVPSSSFFKGGVDEPESENEEENNSHNNNQRWRNESNDLSYTNHRREGDSKYPNRGNQNGPNRNNNGKFDSEKHLNKFANKAPLEKNRQFGKKTDSAPVPVPVVEDTNLHPSWLAKRKQQLSISVTAPVQGKKIKFDD